jgi:hypothetical protein
MVSPCQESRVEELRRRGDSSAGLRFRQTLWRDEWPTIFNKLALAKSPVALNTLYRSLVMPYVADDIQQAAKQRM